MKLSISGLGVLSLFAVMLFTTGCGSSFDASPATPSQTSIGTLQGKVHGGQQPVKGASVYLFATGAGGNGGNGIAAVTANQSTSLLSSSGSNTVSDGTNYYVLTDASGNFTIDGDYSCTAGTQVYLYAVGGDSGSGANSAVGLLAGLGTCPSAKTFATTFVYMNEVTTVATAYALAGFATDSPHISASSANSTGIANAMAAVSDIVNLANGNPYATTHATGSSGTVPQSLIYTVADILASCINSAGPSSNGCSTLLGDARSGGGQTGTKATDTATAAIYLAQHPYSAYVGTLYNLVGSVGTPFTGSLGSAPANYVLALTFTGNGVTRATTDQGYPGTLAIDDLGNVWTINYSTNTVSAFNSLGVPLSGSPFSGNGLSSPIGIAIDTNNRIWVPNYLPSGASRDGISIFNSNGSAYANPVDNGTNCLDDLGNIAFDSSGNAWLSNIGAYWLCKLNSTATSFVTIGGSSLSNPLGLAGDSLGNMWGANVDQSDNKNLINKFNSSGTNVSGSPFQASQIGQTYSVAIDANNNAWISSQNNMLEISSATSAVVGAAITGGGIVEPDGVAVDGANNIWEADYGTYNSTTSKPNGDGAVIELNSSGSPLSGSVGYQAGTSFTGQSIAIDGSGNVWLDNLNGNSVRELLGAAAPVVTPLSLAVKNGKIATRP